MKKFPFLIVSAVLVLTLTSCPSPAVPGGKDVSGPGGSLVISISEQVGNRLNAFTVTGVHEAESFTQSLGSSVSSVTVSNLSFGEWTITVDAFNGDSPPTLIGMGTDTVTVKINETVETTITVLPLGGNGAVNLTVDRTGVLENLTLQATLTSATGTVLPIAFPPVTGNSSTFVKTGLGAGYYTLNLRLLDTGTVVSGAAELVRIVSGQTTMGTVSFLNLMGPGGGPAVSVTVNLKNPVVVTVGRGSATATTTGRLNLKASQAGPSDTPTYTWYVNGGLPPVGSIDSGSALSLPNDLISGYYRVDAVASTSGSSHEGSGSFVVYWRGQVANAPGDPGTGWAYYDTTTCLPFYYDAATMAWYPFSTISVPVAALATTNDAFVATGLGFDSPMEAPKSGSFAPAGFGSTSFFAEVSGSTPTRKYTSLRFRPQSLLALSSLKLNDIKAISYLSKQPVSNTETWYLRIYTVDPTHLHWYLTRINAVITKPASVDWVLNSTSVALTPTNLILFKKVTPFGTDQIPAQPVSLENVKTGINVGTLTIAPHGGEEILFIDIAAGDNDGREVKSYLDGVVLTTTGGKAFALDLGD